MTDRTHQPEIHLPRPLGMPDLHCVEVENGIKLYALEAGTQKVLRLTIVIGAGTRHQSSPFVASALLNMLSEGTSLFSSAEIAEKLDFYGIYYDTSIDRDYGMLTVSCLEKFLPQTLELLEQMLLHPTFSSNELATYCLKRKEQLMMEREKPSYIARELFSVALFGSEHPYGKVSQAELYDNLTSESIQEFYNSHYGAQNMFAVTSGMVSAESLEMIKQTLSKIRKLDTPTIDPTVITPLESELYVYKRREDAMQSSIRIGKRLFTKGHPDFNGMQVVSMVLGGYFSSRLVSNLRQDKGYTYGVYAAMMNLQHDGYIAIATDVEAENTKGACNQIFIEIQRLRTEQIPIKELDMVRNIIAGEIMRIVDGPFGIADVTIEGVQCGCTDNSYLDEFIKEVKEITPERVLELAFKYLDPQTFTTVIVGKNDDE